MLPLERRSCWFTWHLLFRFLWLNAGPWGHSYAVLGFSLPCACTSSLFLLYLCAWLSHESALSVSADPEFSRTETIFPTFPGWGYLVPLANRQAIQSPRRPWVGRILRAQELYLGKAQALPIAIPRSRKRRRMNFCQKVFEYARVNIARKKMCCNGHLVTLIAKVGLKWWIEQKSMKVEHCSSS